MNGRTATNFLTGSSLPTNASWAPDPEYKSLKDKVKSKKQKKTAPVRDGQTSQAATAETTPSNWIERTAFWMGSIWTKKLYNSVVTCDLM